MSVRLGRVAVAAVDEVDVLAVRAESGDGGIGAGAVFRVVEAFRRSDDGAVAEVNNDNVVAGLVLREDSRARQPSVGLGESGRHEHCAHDTRLYCVSHHVLLPRIYNSGTSKSIM